ncbi:hypothetical protein SBOR_7612 [Sclerotinia borealis F-4128]|uniref:Telomeric single stranded DNA binding POT1/Cdc13 domain-containing protein n=1 Tax=Sclerotinia borealis (strain F-4128) TaxID=1432307 RepID=W9C5G5_SCLBF|nr:hypothetical protein SBOR_7612 [Sclerotinia borealis F-4128]
MSTLESTTHIPIAQLTPSLPSSTSKSVKAVVTLTWPYSSRTGSVAFLLAEPDFRLRRTRGQVRVQFSGSSANIIAKSGIASGDEVILCLDGVEYVEPEATNATPGRGVEFELKFTERLLLQFRPEESQDTKLINIDHPDPEPIPTPAPASATNIETNNQGPEAPATPAPFSKRIATQIAEEYSSPAFLKRERTSYGSIFDEGYDPFEVGDGSVREKGRKRTRFSTTWRYTSRSPSPSPEVEEQVAAPLENDIQDPANQHAPAMTDEGVQTMEVEEPAAAPLENGIQDPANHHFSVMTDEGVQTMEVETEVIAEVTQTLHISLPRIIEETETIGIVHVHAEDRLQEQSQVEETIANTMPPPQSQPDIIMPKIEQGTSPDDLVEKLPSFPQLRTLPSEGLPLVSPFVTSRFETFNNHIHKDYAQDLEVPNFPAILSAETDMQIQVDDDKGDLYGASPLRRTRDQPRSDQTNHRTSTIHSGNKSRSANMEAAFPPHQEGQLEAEQGAEQFFPPHNTSDPISYIPVSTYAGMSEEQGQYISNEMEEDMAHYNYPDPEPQSNNWGTQSSMAYPGLEDSQEQFNSYPQHPSMPSMARSQSNQSHQSHQSQHPSQSPQSQIVDLTESDDEDEDAEGYLEVEDNSRQHISSSHLPVYIGEETFYDEKEEDESSVYDDENKVEYKAPPRDVPEGVDHGDDYGEGFSGDDDENMDSRGRGHYFEEDETGSEDVYDEDDYNENDVDNEVPLQRQPPREPEVIDLLSSDDEDEEPAATRIVSRSRPQIPDARKEDYFEDDEINEEEGDTEEDEAEGESEDEDEGWEGFEVGGEEVQNTDMPTTTSQEFVRDSSTESVEDELMGNESTLVDDGDDTVEVDAEMSELVSNSVESRLVSDAQVDVDASLDELEGTQQHPQQQEFPEEQGTVEFVPEPIDVETSSAVKMDTDNTTDNLDGLFEKLEEAGSETQLEQGLSIVESDEPRNDAEVIEDDVQDIGNEDNVQSSDEANADETSSQESEIIEATDILITADAVPCGPELTEDNVQNSNVAKADEISSQESGSAEATNDPTTVVETSYDPELIEDKENVIDSVLEDLPPAPAPAVVEISEDPTIPRSTEQNIIDQAAKSGWANPKHATLFSRTFGLDGANDASNEGDQDNEGQVSYPTLPVTEPEDQQKLDDDPERFSQSENPTHGIDIPTNHRNHQLQTPDNTLKMDVDEDSFMSMSDLLQSQLQKEMGEMDEDIEMIQSDESIEEDRVLATDTETETIDKDKIQVIAPELEDFEVKVTKTEIFEIRETESTEIEVDHVDEDLVKVVLAEAKQVEAEQDGDEEFENEKSQLAQIEADIRKAEMTELETQRGLAKLVEIIALKQDTGMVEVEEEYIEETVKENEIIVDSTEAIMLEQVISEPPTAPLRDRNRKESSLDIKKGITEPASVSPRQTRFSLEPSPVSKGRRGSTAVGPVSPRQTRSSLEPSPESRKVRKGSTAVDPVSPRQTRSSLEPSLESKKGRRGSTAIGTVSPRLTRSRKLEPVVEIITPITPSKSNKENERPSTRGSNRSRKSPSIVLDEEEIPQGHDASAEVALESLEIPELPESPTKAGHQLRAPACTDPKLRLTKYLRTDLSEYTTLKLLRFKMTSKLDVLAIATSVPPEPHRAKSGPKHYTTTFTITDQTIAPSGVVEVRIFRPYKDALPIPEIGDGILLRDFSVLSIKGKGFALRSEEGSSWAIFKDEGTEVEITGPPVEYGTGEKKHMKELREWFHALDDDQKTKLEKVSTAMEKVPPGKSTPEKAKK